MKQLFTNRHGTKVQVDTDLVAAPPGLPDTTEPRAAVPAATGQGRTRRRLSRTIWLVPGVAVLLAVIVGIGGLEWKTAQAHQVQAALRSDVQQAGKVPLKDQASMNQVAARLAALPVCPGGRLGRYFTWYPRFSAARQACLTSAAQATQLHDTLAEAAAASGYLARLQPLIAVAISAQNSAVYAVPDDAAAVWLTFADAQAALTPPPALSSIHQRIRTEATALAGEWATLAHADEVHDAAAFTAAETALAGHYQALRAAADDTAELVAGWQASASRLGRLLSAP